MLLLTRLNEARHHSLQEKIEALRKSMSTTRCIFRFGKPIINLRSIALKVNQLPTSDASKMLIIKILEDIADSLYCFFDHFIYFQRVGKYALRHHLGLIKLDPK